MSEIVLAKNRGPGKSLYKIPGFVSPGILHGRVQLLVPIAHCLTVSCQALNVPEEQAYF